MSMLTKHDAKALSGDTSACDDFASDLAVSLTAESAKGRWEVEGGKDEMCGYLKEASAALTVLHASTSSDFNDVTITRSGFPWMTAEVHYKQRTTITASNLPQITSESDDVVQLKRTLTGLKIQSVKSHATGGI